MFGQHMSECLARIRGHYFSNTLALESRRSKRSGTFPPKNLQSSVHEFVPVHAGLSGQSVRLT